MATAKSMILDMLKTPQQVREEQMKGITSRALGMRSELPRATTGIPGMITNLANQSLVRTAEGMAEMPRRLSGAAGAFAGAAGATPETQRQIAQLGLTQAELQAQQVQDAAQGLDLGNLENMKQKLRELQNSGAPLEATLALSEAIARREKEVFDRAAAQRGEKLQRDLFGLKEREIELDEAKFEAEKILGGSLGDFDLTTEEGVNKAVETLMNNNKIPEAIRLKNAYKKEQATAEKTINFFASKFTNGDMQAAYEMFLESKRVDPLLNPTAKRLDSDYDKAILSRQNIMVANDALKLIDEGRVILGSFAQTRKGAEKFISQVFGIGDKDAVTRTEQLMSKVRTLSAQMLASGMFGSGTGISERDLLEAKEIAGASETLTPTGMAKILRMNAKMEALKLKQYNERLERLPSSFWERSMIPREGFVVETPEMYATPFSIDRAESAAQDNDGNTIYEFNGNWYNADGTQYQP